MDIGANLFVGSLDDDVDENLLHTAFSNFGTLTQPAKVRMAFQYSFVDYM